MRAPAALLLVAACAAAGGCVPSPGPFLLRGASGRVVDADTGLPIADALVLEWYRGGGLAEATRPVYASRWTRTGRDGGFAFDRALAPSPRMWVLRTYGPTYDFYHPSYGLVHGATAPEPPVVLRGSLRDSAQRLADLAPFCRGERDGRAAEKLVEVACPVRDPGVWPEGGPRARGRHDARGRRVGAWTFYREDGSVAARGAYQNGAPVGAWSFPRRGEPDADER